MEEDNAGTKIARLRGAISQIGVTGILGTAGIPRGLSIPILIVDSGDRACENALRVGVRACSPEKGGRRWATK